MDDGSEPAQRGIFRVLRILYVALFVGLAVLAASAAVVEAVIIRASVGTEATVAEVESRVDPNDDDRQQLFVAVTFTADDGEPAEAERAWPGSSESGPEPGDRVDIRYDPNDPTDIRFDVFLDTWFTVISLLAVSAVLAAALMFQIRRKRKRQRPA